MAARVTSLILRLLLATVFLVAGAVKVWDFHDRKWATPVFLEDILNFQIVPWWYVAMALAAYLPWLEIVAGLGLLSRRWRLGALAVVGGLMLVFIGALSSAWWRGIDLACGCFGHEIEREAWWIPFVRDLVLLAMTAAAFVLEMRSPVSPERPADPPAVDY